MLKENRDLLLKIREEQYNLRERLSGIWEAEELFNLTRIRGHEYTQKMIAMTTSEEGAMEHAHNLMDNVLDSIDDALAQVDSKEYQE